jgi:hypothetical protein
LHLHNVTIQLHDAILSPIIRSNTQSRPILTPTVTCTGLS